ncbi:hypothetical protein HMPREF1087_04472 [[Clostridium] clostridioforme 90A1]|nr:hypothetical protein HMPREF1087_04472 [[Clostridium] clostridioforme 90A1]
MSIHKALAGLDYGERRVPGNEGYFNPQGPRGPRLSSRAPHQGLKKFQSTRPSRASTLAAQSGNWSVWQFQSTRPSRASTTRIGKERTMRTDFNPQGPRGPRRVSKNVTLFAYCISIHKALAGLDTAFPGGRWHRLYFNPQGPRGPRRCTATRLSLGARFQSTRPSRASTPGFQ